MKLLIAEDDLMLVKAIEFKLKREGYDLVIVNDGREALLKIASEKPDIIISDIMMPFINGLEIISTVRNDMKLDTPIIMLTSVGLEKTVLKRTDNFINCMMISRNGKNKFTHSNKRNNQ